jgi:NTE family protein
MFKIAAGEYVRFMVEHKQAFGQKANHYINMGFRIENLPLNNYDGSEKKSLYHILYNQFDLNYTHVFGTNWSLAAGIKHQTTTFSPEVTDNLKVKGTMNNYLAYLKSEAKTTDRRLYPTKGYEFMAMAGVVFKRNADITVYSKEGYSSDTSELINGKPEYYRLVINFAKYHPMGRKLVFLYNLQAGITANLQGIIFDQYYMGGVQDLTERQMAFVGLNEGQVTSTSLSSALVGLQYNFSGNLFLTGKLNTGMYNFSTPTKVFDQGELKWINGFSLGLGYNLSILPMEFTAMYSPEIGTVYAHVKIGFLF